MIIRFFLLTFLKDAANSETPGTVKISKKCMGLSNNIQRYIKKKSPSQHLWVWHLKKYYLLSKSITLDNQTYTAPATGQVKPGQVFQNSAERTRSPHLYIEKTIIYALYYNTGSDKIDQYWHFVFLKKGIDYKKNNSNTCTSLNTAISGTIILVIQDIILVYK